MDSHKQSHHSACVSQEHLLEDYLGGSLATAESEKITRHLADCEGCQRALSGAEAGSRVWRLSASLMAVPPKPHPAFARTVMARIREQKIAREAASLWNPFVALAWKFAATASLALLVMVTYAFSHADQVQPETASLSVTQTAVHDIFSPVPAGQPDTRSEAILMVTEPTYANR